MAEPDKTSADRPVLEMINNGIHQIDIDGRMYASLKSWKGRMEGCDTRSICADGAITARQSFLGCQRPSRHNHITYHQSHAPFQDNTSSRTLATCDDYGFHHVPSARARANIMVILAPNQRQLRLFLILCSHPQRRHDPLTGFATRFGLFSV